MKCRPRPGTLCGLESMPEADARSAKIEDLRGRLQKQPRSRLFLELARELHEAGQLADAAQVCTEGVAHHPSYLSARVLLGRIHRDMGNLEEARKELETVLERAPDNLLARRLLAEICREQGDLDGALERFRALLAFSSEDEEIRSTIQEIQAERAGANGDTSEEEPGPAAETVPTPEPEDLHLATPTLAEIFLQQGLVDKAADVYREILQGDPGNDEARLRLSEIESLAVKPDAGMTIEPAPPPPARAEPAPDPAAEARARKVEVLRGFLRAVQKGFRVLA